MPTLHSVTTVTYLLQEMPLVRNCSHLYLKDRKFHWLIGVRIHGIRITCGGQKTSFLFDVHVTVHRDKFLKMKPTRCTNFSNLFLEWNSTCFWQFLCPSSGVSHCTHSNGICQRGLLTYAIAVCAVKNSWWWTEELSETCRVSFQK